MAKKIAIHLGTDERFGYLGQNIKRVTLHGKWALLYSYKGYEGCVEPDNHPAVHNIIEARKDRIRFDAKRGVYVRAEEPAEGSTEAPEQPATPAPAKPVHIPTLSRLVRQLLEPQGHQRANMPVHGGWVVSGTCWDMRQVALIHWAYDGVQADGTPRNMVAGRPLCDPLREVAEMLTERGYRLHSYRDDHNYFFVVPDGV